MHFGLMVAELFYRRFQHPRPCRQSVAAALLGDDETSEAITFVTIHIHAMFYVRNKVLLLLSVFKVSFCKNKIQVLKTLKFN